MKMNKVALSALALCIGYSGFAIASYDKYGSYESDTYTSSDSDSSDKGDSYKDKPYDDTSDDSSDSYKEDDSDSKQRLALNLVGKGPMYESEVPDIDGDKQPDPAICFDVDLKNIADGELVGTATDCLSNIEPGENGGLKLVGTTFFNLPNGQIVTRGLTTVQPVNQTTITPDGEEITHITGASSDQNSVLKATGDYWWYRGTVRLSGMVNLSEFNGNVGDPMFFDCLFTIDLEKIKFKHRHWYKWYKEHYYNRDYNRDHHGHKKYDGSDSGGDSSYRKPSRYD